MGKGTPSHRVVSSKCVSLVLSEQVWAGSCKTEVSLHSCGIQRNSRSNNSKSKILQEGSRSYKTQGTSQVLLTEEDSIEQIQGSMGQ